MTTCCPESWHNPSLDVHWMYTVETTFPAVVGHARALKVATPKVNVNMLDVWAVISKDLG